jgi:hypothetical protein
MAVNIVGGHKRHLHKTGDPVELGKLSKKNYKELGNTIVLFLPNKRVAWSIF